MTPGDRNPNRYAKTKLSAAVLAIIAAVGAFDYADERATDEATLQILDQFILEREGRKLRAYLDGGSTTQRRIWTICKGLTAIEGKPVTQDMVMTDAECQKHDRKELEATYRELKRIVKPSVMRTMPPPARAGATSFCTYNLGSSKCKGSTFLSELNAGRRNEACAQITRWIFDQQRDCRVRANGCIGQVERRQQEDELCLMTDGEPQ